MFFRIIANFRFIADNVGGFLNGRIFIIIVILLFFIARIIKYKMSNPILRRLHAKFFWSVLIPHVIDLFYPIHIPLGNDMMIYPLLYFCVNHKLSSFIVIDRGYFTFLIYPTAARNLGCVPLSHNFNFSNHIDLF